MAALFVYGAACGAQDVVKPLVKVDERWVKSVHQDPTLEVVEELYFYRVQ